MKRILYWLSAAFTAFVNGFLGGWPGASGSAIISGTGIHSVQTTLTETQKILVTIAGYALPATLHGLNEVLIWSRSNPFPNPFPTPPNP